MGPGPRAGTPGCPPAPPAWTCIGTCKAASLLWRLRSFWACSYATACRAPDGGAPQPHGVGARPARTHRSQRLLALRWSGAESSSRCVLTSLAHREGDARWARPHTTIARPRRAGADERVSSASSSTVLVAPRCGRSSRSRCTTPCHATAAGSSTPARPATGRACIRSRLSWRLVWPGVAHGLHAVRWRPPARRLVYLLPLVHDGLHSQWGTAAQWMGGHSRGRQVHCSPRTRGEGVPGCACLPTHGPRRIARLC